jgi:hypothetical protein
MEPITFTSEDALITYFTKFLKTKANAVQLDGSLKPTRNTGVVATFRFSLDGKRYKLLGELKREAIEEFLKIAEEHGSASFAFKTTTFGGQSGITLSTHATPDTWWSPIWVTKAKEKLRDKAA